MVYTMRGPAATQANPAVITRAQRKYVVLTVMKCRIRRNLRSGPVLAVLIHSL